MYIENQPLVSIVSPCWNGERYIARMLDSVLCQTYSNIEMICVNDGSTDKTESIILDYKVKFQQRGMKLQCINQENAGQAVAVNTALKFIKGEFLAWIDCDDFLVPNSVEKRVNALLDHPEYSIVTSDLYLVDESDLNDILERRGEKFGNLNYQPNQFYLTLAGLSIMECQCHMLRVADMRIINPEMEIPICFAGQNYQILLPMYYHYKRFYLDEPLAYYVIRGDSHYHRKRTGAQLLERYDELLSMLHELFQKMNISTCETEKYLKISCFYQEKRRLLDTYAGSEEMVRK